MHHDVAANGDFDCFDLPGVLKDFRDDFGCAEIAANCQLLRALELYTVPFEL